jgi:hypothetical protein
MKGKFKFSIDQAEEIISLINEKLKSDSVKQKGIRAKIRNRGFYASDYGFRDGYTVQDFLSVVTIIGEKPSNTKATISNDSIILKPTIKSKKDNNTRTKSDESYIIDLCDITLKNKAQRQYRFEFLKGDSGTKLPVDAYYSDLNLVIEFREKQHTEEVKFFDKKQTVSGVGRGEQRKIYDQRRRDLLPKHGITLIEIGYDLFEHSKSKKLFRNKENDVKVLLKIFKEKLIIN